ncbi:putative serine/threonine-protein kinase PIX13 [Tasmannia lanceolata]|uniref:putative serine/threonine-protein kinase PIX13 n=1 Tax=Tasmannia lanceolata TaxID=3420 RepID=UPI004063053F
MGNCLRTPSESPSTIRPSSPGISKNNSNEGKISESKEESFPDGQILPRPNLIIFSFSELKNATRQFRSDSILGGGGFGTVFKGWIDEKSFNPAKSSSKIAVAIKKLNPESSQGFQEWKSEVNFLGRLSHPNLVKLLGYCWEDRELLLVYEFMPRGSLENHLFRKGSAFEPLSWSIRLKIAIGAARGLAFLHALEKQIIYRDFKASNILLDLDYNAKISDFGLAKNGPTSGKSHVSTRVIGTYGYAAPEYVATGHLYVKSDVYGFGVVLLEMLSGERALDDSRPNGQQNLMEWAKPKLNDLRKLRRVMDRRLGGQYPSKGALQAAQLTLRCLSSDQKNRPSMKEVVFTLEKISAIKDKPKTTSGRNHHGSPINPKIDGIGAGARSPINPKIDGNGAPSNRKINGNGVVARSPINPKIDGNGAGARSPIHRKLDGNGAGARPLQLSPRR